MCHRRGPRYQPPIVALAGAIYGAYQSRKARKAEASGQEIGVEGGKYAAVPKQNHADAMDGIALHEKGVQPPDYDDVVRNQDDAVYQNRDSDDYGVGLRGGSGEEDNFLAAGEHDEGSRNVEGEKDMGKMGFFERMQMMKENKKINREEKREAWRTEKRAWKERKAERRAEWRVERGRRGGCCGRAC